MDCAVRSGHNIKDPIYRPKKTLLLFTELAMKSEDGEAVISLRFGRLAEFGQHCKCVAKYNVFISCFCFQIILADILA